MATQNDDGNKKKKSENVFLGQKVINVIHIKCIPILIWFCERILFYLFFFFRFTRISVKPYY